MFATAELPADAQVGWISIGLNLAAILLLVLLSGTFSGSEAVLFSLSQVQLQHEAISPSPLRRLVAKAMEHPKRTLMTILVGNTSINVLLFALSYTLLSRLGAVGGEWVPVVGAAASVLLVVVFGEVIPKVVGISLAPQLAPYCAAMLSVSGVVLEPVGRLIDFLLVQPTERLLFGPPAGALPGEQRLSNDELKALLQMSSRHGVINRVEDAFLRQVIELGGMRVRDMMVPRVEVRAYDVNDPADGLRELIRATRFKKIPVCDGSIDNIIGLVYAKILFFSPGKPLRELVTPVRFVPELINCEQLLQHFRATRTQIAIAVDEFGGMAGLVSLEDVLEMIVGDIHDPEDLPPEPEITQLSASEYEISGGLGAHYWAEAFGLPRLTERVATVGGLVVSRLGRSPHVGDAVRIGNVELRVARMQRRRIERLRLRLLEGEAAEQPA